jgi:hypothetical protein|tara:strand:- start:274 stop:864 length:591 start_codon:yes stop_codon:yes gene_type:complete
MSNSQITQPINQDDIDMLNYYYFENAFTPEEIKKIIKLCEGLEINISYTGDTRTQDRLSRTTVSNLEVNEDTIWIYEKLFVYAEKANQEMGWNFNIEGMTEDIEYSQYSDNGGHYVWYADLNNSNYNKLSLTLMLSADVEYSGGKVEYNFGDDIINSPLDIGGLSIIPSYLLKRTTPILSGVMRTLEISITGNPFK